MKAGWYEFLSVTKRTKYVCESTNPRGPHEMFRRCRNYATWGYYHAPPCAASRMLCTVHKRMEVAGR
jgi:hypothetical protein